MIFLFLGLKVRYILINKNWSGISKTTHGGFLYFRLLMSLILTKLLFFILQSYSTH